MDVTMRFRATSEEKQILQAGAKRAGLDFSEWARGVLLSAAGDVAHVEGSPEPESVKEHISRVVGIDLAVPGSEAAGEAVVDDGEIVSVSVLKPGSGGMKRTQTIPEPDWKRKPVPERTKFTPVPKGKK